MNSLKKSFSTANFGDRSNRANRSRSKSSHPLSRSSESLAKAGLFSSLKKIIFARPYLVLLTVIVALVSPSIYAQIKNIYDAKEENISGITSLMSAVASNDVNGVKFFAKAGPALVNQKNLGGATALHIASREGNLEIAQTLLAYGADVNATDNEGWTPLMRATLAGNDAVVGLLLDKGAQASNLNSAKESALTHAVSSDCNKCLSSLFEKFNFMQFMDLDLLKAQLADAFVIARNHENQSAQDMIAAYLDRVSHLSEVAAATPTPVVIANDADKGVSSSQNDLAKKAKKFVFKSDGKTTSVSEKPVITEEEPIVIVNKPEGNFTQQEIANPNKKFKLLVGEQGKLRKKGERMVKSEEKLGVTKEEISKESVVLSSDKKPSEVVVETAAPVNGVVYKFNAGPAGNKIKRKVIKKPLKPTPAKVENKADAAVLEKSSEAKTSDSNSKPAEVVVAPAAASPAMAPAPVVDSAPNSPSVAK
jgi:hypothetical protein